MGIRGVLRQGRINREWRSQIFKPSWIRESDCPAIANYTDTTMKRKS
ncbi:MAG TPA: hypothetical protein V6C95_06005 [Coleofasciculaceae cyanobacterium]